MGQFLWFLARSFKATVFGTADKIGVEDSSLSDVLSARVHYPMMWRTSQSAEAVESEGAVRQELDERIG